MCGAFNNIMYSHVGSVQAALYMSLFCDWLPSADASGACTGAASSDACGSAPCGATSSDDCGSAPCGAASSDACGSAPCGGAAEANVDPYSDKRRVPSPLHGFINPCTSF